MALGLPVLSLLEYCWFRRWFRRVSGTVLP